MTSSPRWAASPVAPAADHLEGCLVVVEVDVLMVDGIPEVEHQEHELHQQRPRVVVGLRELWPVPRPAGC